MFIEQAVTKIQCAIERVLCNKPCVILTNQGKVTETGQQETESKQGKSNLLRSVDTALSRESIPPCSRIVYYSLSTVID